MTDIFIRGMLGIAIASLVICIVWAIIEVIMTAVGRENRSEDD